MNPRSGDETSTMLVRGRGAMTNEPSALRFGGFVFDLRRGELTGADRTPIALRPKVETLLRYLLGAPGQLCSRDELMTAVWPTTVVTDDSLVQVVVELRKALDDRGQRLIRTVPRRGYRFEATVEPVDRKATATATATAETAPAAGSEPAAPKAGVVPESPSASASATDRLAQAAAPSPAGAAGASGTRRSNGWGSQQRRRSQRAIVVLSAAGLALLFGIAAFTFSSGSEAPVRVDEEMAARGD